MKRVSEYKNIYYNDRNYVPTEDEQYDPTILVIYGPGYYVTREVVEEDGVEIIDLYGPFGTLIEAVDQDERLLTND